MADEQRAKLEELVERAADLCTDLHRLHGAIELPPTCDRREARLRIEPIHDAQKLAGVVANMLFRELGR